MFKKYCSNRLTDREQSSDYQWGGWNLGLREWEVQIFRCMKDSRMYDTTWKYSQYFVIAVNGN